MGLKPVATPKNCKGNGMLIPLVSILIGLSIFLVLMGLIQMRTNNSVRDRFNAYLAGSSDHSVTLQELELAEPFFDRVIRPMIQRVARLFAWLVPQNQLNALRHRLTLAGNPGNLNAGDFVGLKGVLLVLVLGMSLLVGWLTKMQPSITNLALLGALTIGAFLLPDIWISRRIKDRQMVLLLSLPDALDMMVIAIEAGLSFDGAVQEIVDKWKNELSRELARVLRDIAMGKARRQALNELSERTGVPDISSLVTALNQAEELGVSISRILTIQSNELRIRRRQRAQERANQAPIKMLFPIVFLIFPAIFAVLLGPAVPQLMNLFR